MLNESYIDKWVHPVEGTLVEGTMSKVGEISTNYVGLVLSESMSESEVKFLTFWSGQNFQFFYWTESTNYGRVRCLKIYSQIFLWSSPVKTKYVGPRTYSVLLSRKNESFRILRSGIRGR